MGEQADFWTRGHGRLLQQQLHFLRRLRQKNPKQLWHRPKNECKTWLISFLGGGGSCDIVGKNHSDKFLDDRRPASFNHIQGGQSGPPLRRHEPVHPAPRQGQSARTKDHLERFHETGHSKKKTLWQRCEELDQDQRSNARRPRQVESLKR